MHQWFLRSCSLFIAGLFCFLQSSLITANGTVYPLKFDKTDAVLREKRIKYPATAHSPGQHIKRIEIRKAGDNLEFTDSADDEVFPLTPDIISNTKVFSSFIESEEDIDSSSQPSPDPTRPITRTAAFMAIASSLEPSLTAFNLSKDMAPAAALQHELQQHTAINGKDDLSNGCGIDQKSYKLTRVSGIPAFFHALPAEQIFEMIIGGLGEQDCLCINLVYASPEGDSEDTTGDLIELFITLYTGGNHWIDLTQIMTVDEGMKQTSGYTPAHALLPGEDQLHGTNPNIVLPLLDKPILGTMLRLMCATNKAAIPQAKQDDDLRQDQELLYLAPFTCTVNKPAGSKMEITVGSLGQTYVYEFSGSKIASLEVRRDDFSPTRTPVTDFKMHTTQWTRFSSSASVN